MKNYTLDGYIKVANMNFIYEYDTKYNNNFINQILKSHELLRILDLLKIDYKCISEETRLEKLGSSKNLHIANIQVFINKAFGLKYDVESVIGIFIETVRNGTNNYDLELEDCYVKSLEYAKEIYGLDKVQENEYKRINNKFEKIKKGPIVIYSKREVNVKVKIYNSWLFKLKKNFKAFTADSKEKLKVNYTVEEDKNISKLKIKIFIVVIIVVILLLVMFNLI